MRDTDRYKIRFVDTWDSSDIVALYKAGGWWKDSYDASVLPKLIQGSFVFAVILDTKIEKAVGMARVLSDGVSDAYIQDFVILKDYRRLGLGKKLLLSLVNFCLSQGIQWIGVVAEPETEQFYTGSGFQPLIGYTPLRYHRDG